MYHTCSRAGWKMTHLTAWPQFMYSLHRFTRKKGIFRSNKRLRHCNPTIVSLSLEFSIDCFDITAGSAPDWHLQSADSKSPACFRLACQNKAQTFRWPKNMHLCPKVARTDVFPADLQDSITGCWGCSNKHEEQFSSLSFLVAQTLPTRHVQIMQLKNKWQVRDTTCVKPFTFNVLCNLNKIWGLE